MVYNFLSTIFHVQLVGSVVSHDVHVWVHETHGIGRNTESIAVGIHQLAELSGLSDLEKEFAAVRAHNLLHGAK